MPAERFRPPSERADAEEHAAMRVVAVAVVLAFVVVLVALGALLVR